MATSSTSVTFHMRLDDYAVVQLLQDIDLEIGQSITISGLGHGLNGTYNVRALPQYLFTGVDTEGDLLYDFNAPIPNQVLFYDVGDNLERTAAIPNGTITYTETCTWITSANIEAWLGISLVSAGDATFLTQCASAANAFCYRRRQEAGYLQDSLTTSPSADVTLGTIQYGGMLYRQRGSISSYAEFDQVAANAVTGLSGVIKQLLGVDRQQVA